MQRIIDLTKKNLKLLIRSKASALIIIIGPLLVIFLAGLAFDNANFYQFKIGTYSDSYSALSNSFVSKLSDKEYSVTRFDSEIDCVDAIKSGDMHACLLFPGSFDYAENNEITFFVDYSKINIAGTILESISSEISDRTSQVTEELADKLVDAFDKIDKEATSKKSTIIALTSENDVMVKSIQDTNDALNLLELSFDASAFKSGSLSGVKTNISDIMDDLSNVSINLIDGIIDDLSVAFDLVEDLNITQSNKDSIQDSILLAANTSLHIQDEINGSKKLTQLQLNTLTGLINNIKDEINHTQGKINRVNAAKVGALANLNSLKTGADNSLLKILELQKGFNSIQQIIKDIEIKDAGTISSPIKTTISPIIADGTYLNYIFPSLIALVLMFTALLLAPTLVILEKKSSAYFRNFISPTKDIHYILATFFTTLLILFVQLSIILVIALFAFSSELTVNIFSTLSILFLSIVVFTLLGMLIGYLFNSQTMAILASIVLGSISLFLSDVLVPLESMPEKIINIAGFNPFLISSSALRRALLFDANVGALAESLSILFGYAILLFLLVYILHYVTKRGSIAQFLHHKLIKKN